MSSLNNKFANFSEQSCNTQDYQKMDKNIFTNMRSRFPEVNPKRLGL